ncbi:MAG: hypothetical protein MUF87_14600 [Anaerolineae bacterium]|jgi:hypothetical protein|nr:hypothetical protein [Anaerolineae bacterium]
MRLPILLYVGEISAAEQFACLVAPRGWQVLIPTEMLEALAMYLFYYPSVVILDDSPLAREVQFHLESLPAEVPLLNAESLHHNALIERIKVKA